MNIGFFEAKNEDIKDIEVLINAAYRTTSTKAWTGEAHLLKGKRVDINMLEEILKEPDTKTYIAKVDNKTVATIQIKKEQDSIHIGMFAVDVEFQSAGVGKKLLEFAENIGKELFKNSKKFVMEVISSRLELIAYYNRRGYKTTNRYIDFPKSDLWTPTTDEELKLVVLEKDI